MCPPLEGREKCTQITPTCAKTQALNIYWEIVSEKGGESGGINLGPTAPDPILPHMKSE